METHPHEGTGLQDFIETSSASMPERCRGTRFSEHPVSEYTYGGDERHVYCGSARVYVTGGDVFILLWRRQREGVQWTPAKTLFDSGRQQKKKARW